MQLFLADFLTLYANYNSLLTVVYGLQYFMRNYTAMDLFGGQ